MQLWSILPSKADEHDALDRQQLVERPQRRDDGVRLVVEEDLGITCVEVLHL